MKEKRSFSGNFPAVWFNTKVVACVSERVVGTLTPSIVRSMASEAICGGLTSKGPRLFRRFNFSTVAARRSCRSSAAWTSSSACAARTISSRRRSGAEEPTTETVTGSKSNCEMLNCNSARDVRWREGVKVTTISAVPSAGMTPSSGVTSKSGWLSRSAISYSNWMGILQERGMLLVFCVPIGTLPKSMIRGNLMSFADGYAWMGTTKFSP
mmetsp:Transcript_125953/g.352670  ORF Transcript_125953/g.352670 Transcript_125953/m.352670 type:complete len:211 (+) Transcript_125953:590-1222(+)